MAVDISWELGVGSWELGVGSWELGVGSDDPRIFLTVNCQRSTLLFAGSLFPYFLNTK
jgi:hypothetical protein